MKRLCTLEELHTINYTQIPFPKLDYNRAETTLFDYCISPSISTTTINSKNHKYIEEPKNTLHLPISTPSSFTNVFTLPSEFYNKLASSKPAINRSCSNTLGSDHQNPKMLFKQSSMEYTPIIPCETMTSYLLSINISEQSRICVNSKYLQQELSQASTEVIDILISQVSI